ncbi:MAG: hypothetical protein RIQ60_3730 [Pseudomonadota bacterium]|jgi:hypothetical protein
MDANIHVLWWWGLLCTVSICNILAWAWSARRLRSTRSQMDASIYRLRRLQLLLSAGYVAGCAWRSAWPVFDVRRQCLFDHWVSNVLVGRSVATMAELCFAAQWTLMIGVAARGVDSRCGRFAASFIVPMIVLAEICSWYSVLTTSNLGHVVEETLWGLSALAFVAGLVTLWPRCEDEVRRSLALWGTGGLAYVSYMFTVDVPMYWSRWIADEGAGRRYLDLGQGLVDISTRWVVSRQWQDWRSEVVWMTLYFSVAVWMSIHLVHAPLPGTRRRNRLEGTKRKEAPATASLRTGRAASA